MKTIIRTVIVAEIEHDEPFNDTYHALHDIILQSDLLDYGSVLGNEDNDMRVVSIMVGEDTVEHLNADDEFEYEH